MISFDFSSHCTGCYACADICPKQCIKMADNKRGFRIPFIKLEDCVNCGLCEKVCPILSEPILHSSKQIFCAYNKDEVDRKIGSSGSIMLILAKDILSRGGVVYGAAFDNKLQLHHTRATTIEQLLLQSKSKYIQSDLLGVYKSVKNDIAKNIPTMFVGTPCQTQALCNFLGEEKRQNILLVDFICHGVPSQTLFNQSIAQYEKKNHCEVVGFSFREKDSKHLRNYKITYKKEGNIYEETGRESQFPYYCGFLKYITFRDSCYECYFAKEERVSDITLGDMWGHEKDPNFTKGFSLIYINTEKGEKEFMRLNDFMDLKLLSSDNPVTYNFAYNHHQEKDLWQKIFAYMQCHFSYRIIESFLFHNYKDVGVFHKFVFLLIGKINKYSSKIKHPNND